MRGKFDRLGRTAGTVSGFDVHAEQHGVGASAGGQAFEAYLAKLRFATNQPSKS